MSTWVIRRSDGTERKVSGYQRTDVRKLSGARAYRGDRFRAALPPKVDLRPKMTTIENQGETSSCVANAVAGAYEYLVKQHLADEAYDVSRLFIYYNARTVNDDGDLEDQGSQICDAIEGLKQYGACSEETWPFDEEAVNIEPGDEAFEEAAEFLVQDVELVPTELDKWKRCLAEGYPIIFGISLFDSFDSQRKKGLVPIPSPREAARESHAGHAMLCVGYSDRDQVFIVRNSWGEDWGDNGYCYIPYSYLMNGKYNDGDSWIIRRLDAIPEPQEQWGDAEESVVEELDSELANMDDASYAAMLDAMGDVPLETRVALLFLQAAGADGELSEDEVAEIAEYLGHVLEAMGVNRLPDRVLCGAKKYMGSQKLLDETVELLGEHLSNAALAGITAKLEEVVGADGESDEEREFLDALVEAWQVDAEEGDEDEEDDEEEGEEDEA